MRQINIHEAKTHLSRLVEEVANGDDIVIAKAGKPVARLVAIEPQHAPRKFGLLKGRIQIADDFDAPLPADLLDTFEG
ncbi:MAG: putative Antitoxin of toxin-antitoxin system, phd type [Chloroflexi bacterium]|jgi:prevent-host-death family protein|nr:putative Antitoxin of toxin-antitoxin system, phd type [Chloroflexota bacterium]